MCVRVLTFSLCFGCQVEGVSHLEIQMNLNYASAFAAWFIVWAILYNFYTTPYVYKQIGCKYSLG